MQLITARERLRITSCALLSWEDVRPALGLDGLLRLPVSIASRQVEPSSSELAWGSETYVCGKRLLAITWDGNFCLVPELTHRGDEIYVLNGGDSFFLLRKDSSDYLLVRDCYVHGVDAKEVRHDRRYIDGLRSKISIK